MRNKKGDLSLSINAIVILILAITMLGLGLAFMRNIFGSATKEFEEVGGTVKKQMIDQMKESNKIVDISRPKVELKTGESTQVFIGFKNDGNAERKFTILTALPGTSLSQSGDQCNIKDNLTTTSKEVYLEFKTTPTSVLQGDVTVLPINIKTTSDVLPDTCFYELQVKYKTGTDPETNITTELTVDIIN
jgi:hypothetical protein